jgi:CheY-like chemotaxis protein
MTRDSAKQILLIDYQDGRRDSRVKILESAGYTITVHDRHQTTEKLEHEDRFDLIVLALHTSPAEAASYSDRLTQQFPRLPILLLTDSGIYVPKGTLSRSMEAGIASELLTNIAEMLAGTSHVREIE